jgi:hypothetical protein
MSVSGGILFFGESILSWHSRKQRMISLSTAEAESHALVDMAKEIIYVHRLVDELSVVVRLASGGMPVIYSDNQPALDAVANGRGRTKHYDLRIKFLGLGVQNEMFAIEWISTEDNIGDLFTKVLRGVRFKMLRAAMVCDCKLSGNSI